MMRSREREKMRDRGKMREDHEIGEEKKRKGEHPYNEKMPYLYATIIFSK